MRFDSRNVVSASMAKRSVMGYMVEFFNLSGL